MIEGSQLCLVIWSVIAGIGFVIWSMLPISFVMDRVGERINFPDKPDEMSDDQYNQILEKIPGGDSMGFFERFVFFIALASGAPSLVVAWLGFKVASKWDAWRNIYQVPDSLDEVSDLDWFLIRRAFGARIYQRFVIGTAANFLAAAVGAGITRGTLWMAECLASGAVDSCASWL